MTRISNHFPNYLKTSINNKNLQTNYEYLLQKNIFSKKIKLNFFNDQFYHTRQKNDSRCIENLKIGKLCQFCVMHQENKSCIQWIQKNSIQYRKFSSSQVLKRQSEQKTFENAHKSTQNNQQAQQSKQPDQNPYIVSLRKFFLQVHPDFFEGNSEKQLKNQTSFVKLNQILDWLSQLKVSPQIKTPPTPIELFFHLRKSEKIVKVVFNLTSEKLPITLQRAEFLVDKCVHDLLIQSGVPLPEGLEDRDFEAEEVAMKSKDQKMKLQEKRISQIKTKKDNLREELRLAVANDLHRRDPNLVKYGWWTETLPDVEALIEMNMILFHKDISPIQSMDAIERVKMNLQEMKYHLWSDIPIMFGKKYDCESIKGVIIVPYNFEVGKFVKFIEENVDKVKKLAEDVQKEIDQFESKIVELQITLKLDQLTFSIPKKLSQEVIDRLYPIVKNGELNGFPLEGSHIVIGNEFYIDFNNACIGIANDFKDGKEIINFFNFLTNDNIIACAKKNIEEKEDIAQANSVAMEIMYRLGCIEFNIDKYCASSAKKKLKCLNRLKDYCLMLKQYGWDEFVIYLSDEVINVDIQPENRIIYLPLDFSEGDLFYQAENISRKEKAIAEGRMLDMSGNIVPEEFTELFKFQEEIKNQFKVEMEKAKNDLEEEARKLKEIEDTEARIAKEKEEILRKEFMEEIQNLIGEYEEDLEDVLSEEDLAFLRNEGV